MKVLLLILSILTGLLAGDFNATTLSVDEQDSILQAETQESKGESTSGQSPISNLQSPISTSGRYRLQKENTEKIFRHSELADWFVFDTMRHTRKQLGDAIKKQPSDNTPSPLTSNPLTPNQSPYTVHHTPYTSTPYTVHQSPYTTNPDQRPRDAIMSPNGRYVAFAIDNNLYIHKCDFGTELAITKNADPDIISGVSDWLYEEEFATTALFAWSPDSKQLAFVQLNESDVPAISWSNYLRDSVLSLRYPRAGKPNAIPTVCIYDVATKGTLSIPLTSNPITPNSKIPNSNIPNSNIANRESLIANRTSLIETYIPRLTWTPAGELIVLTLNRDQNKMEVLAVNPKSTVSHPLYTEESKKYYIDYSLFDQWIWLTDGRIVILSERDGWRRAYLHDAQGAEIKPLTPEGIDVTALYAVDESIQTLYYQAAPTPATRQIFALNFKKNELTQLTQADGCHAARFSKDAKRFIDCFQSFDTPNTYTLYELKAGKLKGKGTVLLDNDDIAKEWKSYNLPEPQLLSIPNAQGKPLEAMLMLPNRKSKIENRKSPLVLMHYSGPASQRVLNRWRKRFEYALVEAGYAVLIVDPRGSDCKGREWRNETYMSLGLKESEDLIAAANWAAQQPDIDGTRMAIMGWSYGGYQTLFTMSRHNHPFKAGVAIAPVTDWRLYDSAYTERYMRRPQVNDRGYNTASLIPRAKDLNGELLIIHGTGDDNVHVQHTMQYIDALVRANKQFEMQLYPDDNHFLRKGNNAQHMHTKIMNFLDTKLK